MADLSKLHKRRLPPPPTIEEASTTLQEPETAPAIVAPPPKKVDKRRLRKTGRTEQFATRVSADFDKDFRATAKREKVLHAELLEMALYAFKSHPDRDQIAAKWKKNR
jgi:hypothetical protein